MNGIKHNAMHFGREIDVATGSAASAFPVAYVDLTTGLENDARDKRLGRRWFPVLLNLVGPKLNNVVSVNLTANAARGLADFILANVPDDNPAAQSAPAGTVRDNP